MNNTELCNIIQNISDNDNFLIVIHDKADGDAVGSSSALALFINKLGKKCAVLSPAVISSRLRFIMSKEVTYIEGKAAFEASDFKYDYVISLDVASPQLLGSLEDCIASEVDMVIDHHRANTIDAPIKHVDSDASATGEILFNLFSMYAVTTGTDVFDTPICKALFASISSDTGCFKYGNTTSKTHDIASKLMTKDINAEEINRLLFDTKSLTQIQAEQLGFKNMQMFYDNRLAITVIDISDLDKIGASEDDTETISQIARTIEGVQIGVMMREKDYDGKIGYRFSVRANADTDVSLLCATFNGGGHKKAAGCTIFDEKDKALKAFVEEAEKYLI